MYKIVKAEFLNSTVKMFEIEAPAIAAKQRPGQFVILRIHEFGERIPITISDASSSGTITIIVQSVGKTTHELLTLNAGDSILDVVGPLGKATEVKNYGTCVVVGGGVGTAIAYPTAKALKAVGNKVIVIIGGRTSEYAILKDQMATFADEVYVTTDDGSLGTKGFVTDKLKNIIESTEKLNYVLAIGPIPMMRAVAVATLIEHRKIKTIVSLNPVMVDGTGMCGGCRAVVDGKNVFVCVDGPEFDAHKVDFESLRQRNEAYGPQEHSSECIFQKTLQTT